LLVVRHKLCVIFHLDLWCLVDAVFLRFEAVYERESIRYCRRSVK
jgi:hypothetical protein